MIQLEWVIIYDADKPGIDAHTRAHGQTDRQTQASKMPEGKICPRIDRPSWWRHQMETFSAQLAICAGNSPVPGEFPAQRPVTRSFDVFFDSRLNKRLSKQPWGWWFETPAWSLWRHRNGYLSIWLESGWQFRWLLFHTERKHRW